MTRMKKRKPDLFVVLAVLIGLGVVATGLTQGNTPDPQARASYASHVSVTR